MTFKFAFYDNPGKIEHFISWGGGGLSGHFSPPPKLLLNFPCIWDMGLKFFFRKQKLFCSSKIFFLMGNQKWQKKMVLKIWKSPKWVKFEHFEKIALWENFLGLFVAIPFVVFIFSPKKFFYSFRETKRIHSRLFGKN